LFDPTMTAQLPEDQLANAWRTNQELLGAFQSAAAPTSRMAGELTVELVPVRMANGDGTIQIVFHPDGTIAGLFFRRAEVGASAPACAIASPWPADFSSGPVSAVADPAAAAWLGVWEGTWRGPFPDFVARLGFERIEASQATGVYAYPEQGGNQGQWLRFTGQRSGNRIEWDNGPFHFTFTLGGDGQEIAGERSQAGNVPRAAFTRCSA
jgi:hypothetical protein